MGQKARAFTKGGCGCLAAFFLLGTSCVLIGGSMHIDLGGAIMLFVGGGVLGLIVMAIYNRGAREGRADLDPDDSNRADQNHPD